jgi:hypothetical protein
MRLKSVLLIASVALITTIVLTIQSCKNDAVVQTTTPENQNPAVPNLSEPVNNATISMLTPTINWEDFSGASSYRIQISFDANFAGIMIMDSSGITVSQINIRPGLLVTNSYYYWRVRAVTGSGITPWSDVWRFNVILSPPAAPNLIAPPNGAMNQSFTPTLDWSDVPAAQSYRVQISSNQGFNFIVYDSNMIPTSQVVVPEYVLSVNSHYFWRTNASNSGGISTGPWSSVWNFTTMNGPEPSTIKGTVTFVDTNFLPLPSYYRVGAFDSWPPTAPVLDDSLVIVQSGNHYTANYRIGRLDNGSYFIAVFPVLLTTLEFKILGIYGCDTVHVTYSNCPYSPTTVNIINGWGSENINFLSWADTTQKIF